MAQWGNWKLNTKNACLEFNDPKSNSMIYQVFVDEMTDSAQILDWIFQIEEKTWASSKDLGDLVSAVVEILGRSVASGGINHPIDPKVPLANRFGIKFA
jgi:hypothetical protein